MYHRYKGDSIGPLDEDGIAEWYPKCKVRKEGDVYIATPHTTNPARRSVRPKVPIAVTVNDGKYELANAPASDETVTGRQVHEQDEKSPHKALSGPFMTTFKELFDELYDKYSNLKPHEQKRAIFNDIVALFADNNAAEEFTDINWRRKRRNLYVRRKRFEYKAYNQNYEFFFTVTYDDKKHTAQSFEKSLKNAFSNLHKRYGCLIQGVWEYGREHERLHFHGLLYDPQHKIRNSLEQIREYNPQSGRMKTFLQSKYFAERFGRNEFSEIIPEIYSSAVNYITKYLSKQNVRPYYSRGLYRYIESDIRGEDVLGKMDDGSGRDIRLLVAGDFDIWQDGENIGKPAPETLARARKLP